MVLPIHKEKKFFNRFSFLPSSCGVKKTLSEHSESKGYHYSVFKHPEWREKIKIRGTKLYILAYRLSSFTLRSGSLKQTSERQRERNLFVFSLPLWKKSELTGSVSPNDGRRK
ncbi:MAG: hypothetical protein HYV65_01390 [Candidatus Spechtbacteria bacterium]|nr:hypothetical protein [Candidatus Spechtbacteria bacterium]